MSIETSEYHAECPCGAPLVSPVRESKCDREWLTPEGERRKPCGRLIRFDWPIYEDAETAIRRMLP